MKLWCSGVLIPFEKVSFFLAWSSEIHGGDYGAGENHLPGGAGGEPRQAGANRQAIARSVGGPCPHPRRGLWRVPFRFRDGGGSFADRMAASARPRSGRTDRGDRR